MASEEDGGVSSVERRGTLELLIPEARRCGWRVREGFLGCPSTFFSPWGDAFTWPPHAHVRKSGIPSLLCDAKSLCAVPTLRPSQASRVGLPLCVKPDRGSLGIGFQRYEDSVSLREVQALPDSHWVVQPLLYGVEFRVSLCQNGAFASAMLIERDGHASRWRDVTQETSELWLADLAPVVKYLAVPVIGVDILLVDDTFPNVIDVNTGPDIAIHLVTRTPRNMARSVLDSWVAMRSSTH